MSEQPFSDEELIQQVAQGESQALAELYDRYARLVFSMALKLLNDKYSAEEAVQEVFAKVWRNAKNYQRDRGKVSTWISGVAHHHCVDELRRRRVRPIPASENWAVSEETDDLDPADAAALALEYERVLRALQQIPREQRIVIDAAYFQGLTLHEIATQLGTPLGTIKTRLRLGMEKLRKLLQD